MAEKHGSTSIHLKITQYQMCFNFEIPKIINFSFGTNENLMNLGVPILNHCRVFMIIIIYRLYNFQNFRMWKEQKDEKIIDEHKQKVEEKHRKLQEEKKLKKKKEKENLTAFDGW